MPRASGQAKVESKKGYIEIEVEFRNLVPATKFGTEYLTYVLWAITPEGRAVNLGEILLDKHSRGKLDVTTKLQVFGLVVTAGAQGASPDSPVATGPGSIVKGTHGAWQDSCRTPPGAKEEKCALVQSVTAEDRPNVGLTVVFD